MGNLIPYGFIILLIIIGFIGYKLINKKVQGTTNNKYKGSPREQTKPERQNKR